MKLTIILLVLIMLVAGLVAFNYDIELSVNGNVIKAAVLENKCVESGKMKFQSYNIETGEVTEQESNISIYNCD